MTGPTVIIPPDPVTVAPPVNPTVVSTVREASEFLYAGTDSIQTGVAPGTIDLKRAAVLRGRVLARDNTAISGVAVTVLGHAEYGRTVTREDGMFDLAVNGGGLLTVNYMKPGYMPVQRQVQVSWQDYAWAPDIVLVPYDNQVTAVDLASPAPMQVARGSVVTDADGTRQPTLLISQGTAATITLPDGSSRALSQLHVRATEYTIGTTGPNAMPAPLPPSTAYTYAVELSVDEAIAGGASEVRFDRPVYTYLENFLNFPVGAIVPAGYYDRSKGVWVPSENGKVIKILGVAGGFAALDTDGDSLPDDPATLSAIGITDAERQVLANRYSTGQSLWRVPITHFSPYDFNYPIAFYSDAKTHDAGEPELETGPIIPCPNIETNKSIIECQGQVLGESFSITGTPFNLNYRSNRVPGRKDTYTLDIPISNDVIPPSLKRIDMEIHIAGRRFLQTFPAAPNQNTTFEWDGRDAYGRILEGAQRITIRIGYVYYAVFTLSQYMPNSFGSYGGTPLPDLATRAEGTLWKSYQKTIGTWDAKGVGMGGFTLDFHHTYDPVGHVLLLGNGTNRSVEAMGATIRTVAGGTRGYGGDGGPATSAQLWGPESVTVAPDGSIYIADAANRRVRKIGVDGIITTVAGNGIQGYGGDGGPATQAQLMYITGVAVGPDGSLYIADYLDSRIRKVDLDGIITTVAGNGIYGYGGDGGPATQAQLSHPDGIAVSPSGDLYIADTSNGIRKVATDGIITTVVAMTGMGWPSSVHATPDGNLYISHWPHVISRVSPDGILTTVAGTGTPGYSGDGGPATEAQLDTATGVSVGIDGSIYIADKVNDRIRRVGPDGIITTIAGSGDFFNGQIPVEGGLASQVVLYYPQGVATGPDGSLFIVHGILDRILKVGPAFPGLSTSDYAIASEDGKQLYIFDSYGKHLRTMNALNGTVLYHFAYGPDGLLSQLVDIDNNITTIERDASGNPMAIVAPGGQRTTFSLDVDGYLGSITNPAGDNVQFVYKTDGGGLLDHMVDKRGYLHWFAYDSTGRLIRDDDPAGGFTSLDRTDGVGTYGYDVNVSTALGRTTGYSVFQDRSGITTQGTVYPGGANMQMQVFPDERQNTWFPDGSVTEAAQGPDPRFGMQSPVPVYSMVSTPNGLVSITSTTRTATLDNAEDPLSLLSQRDTMTVNGRIYRTIFDNATRLITTTTPAGRRTESMLDGKGRIVSLKVDDAVSLTTFSYDSQGLLFQAGRGTDLWTHDYDSKNRLWKKTDPLGYIVEYAYDDADRVNMVRLPSGRTYRFESDRAGNRTKVIMPNLAEHELGSTPVNLDNSYLPPFNPPYVHQYSLDREWTLTTLPSGRPISAGYDPVSARLLTVSYPEGAVGYGYADNTDRIFELTRTGADNSFQRIDYDYDGFLTTRMASSGTVTGEFRYAYNNNFWTTAVALDNAWNLLSRDDDGLRTGDGPFTIGRGGPAGSPDIVSDLVPRTCALDNDGLPTVCPPGTLDLRYGYDSFGRVNRRTQTFNGMPVYEVVLDRNPVGRIIRKIETLGEATSTFDYSYDVDGQLIEVRRNGALSEQYGYDNNANRTSTLGTTSTYDDQDRLLQQGGVNYTFDVDGYLTTRGSDTFTYSARGELLSVTVGGQTITYQYDGTNRRVGRTNASGTTQYLYGNLNQPFQVTASRATDNVLTVYYYDDFGALNAMERGGVRYYVASDHLGTPKVITDNTGTIVRQVEYDSWGVKISDTNPGFDLPVGFAGGIHDDTTGLVRFGFRDYEPGTGRWAAKDPIFFRGGLNLYQYARNNPVNRLDRSGLCNYLLGAGGGAFVGGIGGEINFGIIFNTDLSLDNFGFFLSTSGEGIGMYGSIDFVTAGRYEGNSINDAAGTTLNANAAATPISGTVQYNEKLKPVGGNFAYGPGAGGSMTKSTTSVISVRKILDAISGSGDFYFMTP
ncbi:MAG: hypothetical protein C4529_10605 [Deltaproteobacteria bacterium]|nr:MAG: hypothetical protein C4529_10605 [Deltaproteobacteria bacterium]